MLRLAQGCPTGQSQSWDQNEDPRGCCRTLPAQPAQKIKGSKLWAPGSDASARKQQKVRKPWLVKREEMSPHWCWMPAVL